MERDLMSFPGAEFQVSITHQESSASDKNGLTLRVNISRFLS